MVTRLQSLFVVRRDRPDLYECLCGRFGENSEVVLDRRNGERRTGSRPVTPDRRRRERRQPLTRPERALWEDSGYCLIFKPDPGLGWSWPSSTEPARVLDAEPV